jgi:phenylalanyl-tRNA synthetase beta chain
MLCSASELGIGSDASGLLILSNDAPIGQRLSAILGVEDTVFDIAVTPNRGDCLSILGIAREIAALTGQHLRRQRVTVREAQPAAAEMIAVRVADPDLCGRYAARVLLNLKIAASPLWLQSRLLAVGLRPINNVVDVTNYVMIERGQPLHAFDYDRLSSKEIVVRRAGAESTFTTLDGQTRQLQPEDLMICSGEVPVAIAGIMGGADTEVTLSTQRILLESAWFNPSSVRRTAKRLGLRSEASYRFERATDIEGVISAADRAAALMARLGGATITQGRIDAYVSGRQSAPISLRLKRVGELLGMEISRAEVTSRLKALELSVSPATRGTLTVLPPSHRSDLTREIDLIEEIARLGGYENVPTTLPECTLTGTGQSVDQRRQRDLKRFCAAQGLNEVVFLSFCSPHFNTLFPGLHSAQGPVRVLNPLTQEDSELRLSLLPGLIRIVRNNLDQGVPDVAVFCIGKVFWRDASFSEARRLAFAVCPALPGVGIGSRSVAAEFVDVKGIVEALLGFLAIEDVRWTPLTQFAAFHPGKTAGIEVAGETVGVLGALHPALEDEVKVRNPCWLFEIDLDRLLQYSPSRFTYRDLPRFPAVVRDVAVVTDESFASDELVRFVREWNKATQLIDDVCLFDQYSGPPIPAGKKSLAYSVSYRAPDRTLTDSEVNALHMELIAALKNALHVEPR